MTHLTIFSFLFVSSKSTKIQPNTSNTLLSNFEFFHACFSPSSHCTPYKREAIYFAFEILLSRINSKSPYFAIVFFLYFLPALLPYNNINMLFAVFFIIKTIAARYCLIEEKQHHIVITRNALSLMMTSQMATDESARTEI